VKLVLRSILLREYPPGSVLESLCREIEQSTFCNHANCITTFALCSVRYVIQLVFLEQLLSAIIER
jgi:hypothetical protein